MNMPGGFKESALRLNAYLVKLTEWNEDHIKERAQQLAAKAVQIWPLSQLDECRIGTLHGRGEICAEIYSRDL